MSPRYPNRAGKCQAGAGSTPSSMNRNFTSKPDSFAHVARTPDDNEEEVDDSQGREQDLLSGRCGTRTHDLSRVNPFQYAARHDDGRCITA